MSIIKVDYGEISGGGETALSEIANTYVGYHTPGTYDTGLLVKDVKLLCISNVVNGTAIINIYQILDNGNTINTLLEGLGSIEVDSDGYIKYTHTGNMYLRVIAYA